MHSGLVLIAANWCSDTSRHTWSVCIMVRTEGTVKCFSVRAVFDYPELCIPALLHKRKAGIFISLAGNETFVRTRKTFVLFCFLIV